MLYMTPDNRNLLHGKDSHYWGQIVTPATWATSPKIDVWCGDNEAFTKKYTFERFYNWLQKFQPYKDTCVFISAPDVVGSAKKTIARYPIHYSAIKRLGYPVAFVGQDGLEQYPTLLNWLPFDALFLGGSTKWKMSPNADTCIFTAKRRGKWTHVGRVNSQKRIRHFKLVGVDSVDGTSLTYAPDRDFKRFQATLWQNHLFEMEVT